MCDFCVVYKFNIVFYEVMGLEGWEVLWVILEYIGDDYLKIVDVKCGDIGNILWMYVIIFFEILSVDVIMVVLYMGEDFVKFFFNFEDKWVILLVFISN